MSRSSLQGKSCFITGAASGIGRATALLAAERGARLLLTDVDAEGLASVVREVRVRGGTVAEHAAFDIAQHGDVQAFAERIHARHGSVDVLMNIAGIAVWGSIDELEHRHWRRAVEVNLMGPIHVLECFVPRMIREGRGGHIVNVSSAAGLFGLPWHAAYSASKFGLRGISEVLRFDLARHGIHVSLVCPGGVDTGLVNTVELPGIDLTHPAVRAFRARFRRRAVSPEVAARAILAGMARRRYLVFTSRDIALGHFLQEKLPFAYELVMKRLNDEFTRLKRAAARGPLEDARVHA